MWKRTLAKLPIKMLIRNTLGSALILIGMILWITPVLPGGFLIIPGVLLLDFPQKRAVFRRLEQSILVRRLLQSSAFAGLWRKLRRQVGRGSRGGGSTAGSESLRREL